MTHIRDFKLERVGVVVGFAVLKLCLLWVYWPGNQISKAPGPPGSFLLMGELSQSYLSPSYYLKVPEYEKTVQAISRNRNIAEFLKKQFHSSRI